MVEERGEGRGGKRWRSGKRGAQVRRLGVVVRRIRSFKDDARSTGGKWEVEMEK